MHPSDDSEPDDLTRPATLAEHWAEVPGRTDEWKAGQRLGPFRLRRQLGRGGMGVVWLADQLEPLNREVAIKVLSPGNRSRLAEAYFEVERQSLAQLSHQAIARIFDAGRLPDGGLFFAMEYVHAEPLDQFLHRHPLDFAGLARLLIEICGGVQHAHQRGLIHRDLKPGNILVRNEEGIARPKIIDFGIAISTGVQADAERTGYLRAGTRAYMAPEQRRRDAGGIDVRTDVHALGIVLAEMLMRSAGVVPDGDPIRAASIIRDQLARSLSTRHAVGSDEAADDCPTNDRPTDDTGLAPPLLRRIPHELRAIAARAMATDPAHRYPSAAAMADDLRRWLEKRPVEALDGGRMYRLRCYIRRNAVATGAAALTGLFLVVGIVMALYGLGEAREGRTQAEQARQLAEQRRNDAEQLIQFMLGDFAGSLRPIGRLDLLDGIADEALRYLTDAQADNTPLSNLSRARALRTLGEVHAQRGQRDQAAEVLAQAAALLEPWSASDDPALAELHFESGQIAFWRGSLAYRAREWDDAERHFRRYLDDARRFSRSGVDPTRARWELAYAWNNLGSLAEGRNRPGQALEYFLEAARYRRELAGESGVTGVLGLANNLSWISRAQGALGQTAQAWFSAREALELVAAERAGAPDDARLRQAEINFRMIMARMALRLGLTEEARVQLDSARPLALADVANDPTQTRRQAALAIIELMLARLPSIEFGRAAAHYAHGRQAFTVARERGLDSHQDIELLAHQNLAALRLNPVQSAEEAGRALQTVLDALTGRQEADTAYMVLLELATELAGALTRAGSAPATGQIQSIREALEAVPPNRRNDLRYYLAKSTVTRPPSGQLASLLEAVRSEIGIAPAASR